MTVSTARRWNSTQGAWLALAVLAHAVLLLLPLRTIEIPVDSNSLLKIQLSPLTPVEGKAPLEAPRLSLDTPDAAATRRVEQKTALVKDTKDEASKDKEATAALTPVSTEPEAEKPQERLSLARLIDSLQGANLDAPVVPGQRQLGAHPSAEMPSYWRAGVSGLLPADNLFSGMVNPVQTEIVDRWLAADGSHNVVVNLPNGQTLCGRAPAWDPMRPLVENVMEFRTCGGGGQRSFSMPARQIPEFRYGDQGS